MNQRFKEQEMSTKTEVKDTSLAIFVDVIVPLYVPGTFTYRVPRALEKDLEIGRRVLVPFGKRKIQAALICKIHDKAPREYQAKYILDLLDDHVLVLASQLQLWSWISEYYMCYIGEVMSAAMPGAFRLNSETVITRYDDQEEDLELDSTEHMVMGHLKERQRLNMAELQAILGSEAAAFRMAKSLMDRRVISLQEEVKTRYRPIYDTYLEWNSEQYDEAATNELFQSLEKRAPQQVNLLLRFLALSKHGSGSEIPVLKKELLEKSDVSAAVLKAVLDKGILIASEHEVGRVKNALKERGKVLELSSAQEKAFEQLKAGIAEKGAALLHGVTSSGKTEVYVSLIKEYLARGKQVLYLVPEIGLTTQLIQRLQKHFGEQVVVYHSHHSQSERAEIWENLVQPGIHDHRIVVGARSALFLPFRDLGLIIIDEEHDSSFKQFDPAPRYHARDTAFILGRIQKANLVLGSATPSAESLNACTEGRMAKVILKERYGDAPLPSYIIADIKKEYTRKTMKSMFSSVLVTEMQACLDTGKQIILFQNRRGYNPLWQCLQCAWKPQCNRCDVTLTYHRGIHKLKCHYCAAVHDPPIHCPSCGSKDLKMIGFGTEKIEDELKQILPKAKVSRMDVDTTRGKYAHAKLLQEFEQHKVDILVGTQMVTKGLDFANVALVGILNADQLMNHSDFRAYERAYQMMTQVAGRAGRDSKGVQGKVVIQTMEPDHWVIQNVIEHSYKRLMDRDLVDRKEFKYPPFTRLIRITLRHKNQDLIDHAADDLSARLTSFLGGRLLGPQYPYIARIKDQYRKEILIKIEKEASVIKVKERIQKTTDLFSSEKPYRSIRTIIDVDPQ
jgi:primosomal protein N' (replication factor Y)